MATKYVSPSKFAELHGKSRQRVSQYLAAGRIKGAQRLDGNGWIIPASAPWPGGAPYIRRRDSPRRASTKSR